MNNVTHSYRDRIALPLVEKSVAKAEAIGVVGLMIFVVLIVWAGIVFGPSMVAVAFASIAIP